MLLLLVREELACERHLDLLMRASKLLVLQNSFPPDHILLQRKWVCLFLCVELSCFLLGSRAWSGTRRLLTLLVFISQPNLVTKWKTGENFYPWELNFGCKRSSSLFSCLSFCPRNFLSCRLEATTSFVFFQLYPVKFLQLQYYCIYHIVTHFVIVDELELQNTPLKILFLPWHFFKISLSISSH